MTISLTDIAAGAEALRPAVPLTVPGRVLAVDADYLCYWAGGGPDAGTSRRVATERILRSQEAAGAEHVILCLTARGSLKGDRPLMALRQPYQGQRAGRKPDHWLPTREWLEAGGPSGCKAFIAKDREADDVMAGLAYHRDAVILTKDKDLRMVVGWHLNWDTWDMVRVQDYRHTVGDKDYGLYWFFTQMLIGDTADHIPNVVRGFGPAKAKALLSSGAPLLDFRAVVAQYKKCHPTMWAPYFCEAAGMLWMRVGREARADEWHTELRELVEELTQEEQDLLAEALAEQTLTIAELKKEAACLSD